MFFRGQKIHFEIEYMSLFGFGTIRIQTKVQFSVGLGGNLLLICIDIKSFISIIIFFFKQ